MDLSDALGGFPSGGNNQSGGPWPGQPLNPNCPAANPTWPGAPSGGGGGGVWPGGPAVGGGGWPGGPAVGGGGGGWPGAPSGGGGGGGWPGAPSGGGGGGGWPGAPSGGGGGGGWPGAPSGGGGGWPGAPSGGGVGGGGGWPGGPSGGGMGPSTCPQPSAPGQWPSPSTGPGSSKPAGAQHNLKVPYSLPLPTGVYDKMLITIAGTIKPNADRIAVDICTSDDLAFHFNPRFNEGGRKVMVRNSRIGGRWGKEERDAQHFPFVQGQPFEMKILCTNQEFKVSVSKSPWLDYKHRITNLRSINKVNIHGDLSLSMVNVGTMS